EAVRIEHERLPKGEAAPRGEPEPFSEGPFTPGLVETAPRHGLPRGAGHSEPRARPLSPARHSHVPAAGLPSPPPGRPRWSRLRPSGPTAKASGALPRKRLARTV